jgi:hypothetical protein
MKTKLLTLLVIVLITGQTAIAQKSNFSIHGKDDFYFHFPVNTGGKFEYPITAPKFVDLIGIKVNNSRLKFVSDWQIRSFVQDFGQQNDYVKLLARENYLKYKGNKLNITVGWQKFSWGMADKINPTDRLNPRDYTLTAFETQKIPVFATTADYYPSDKWKLQAVYIPYKQKNDYFWKNSDFIPDEFFEKYTISDIDFTTSKPELTFIQQNKTVIEKNPEFGLKSPVLGGKINFYSSAVDLALGYIYDYDNFFTPDIYTEKYYPGITPELQTKIQNTLPANDALALIAYLNSIQSTHISKVDLLRKRIHRFNFSAKTIVGKFGLWAEAAYSVTTQKNKNDFKNRSNELFYVLGTDFNFGANEQHYANVQYIGKWLPNFYNGFYSDYPNGLPEQDRQDDETYMQSYYYKALTQTFGLQNAGYLHALSANVKFSFLEGKLKPSILAYVQIPENYDNKQMKRYAEMFFMPTIDYSPGNALHFILGAYLAYAPYKPADADKINFDNPYTMLGLVNQYNNIFLKVSYSWNYKK